jgi:hypothetical protein
MEKMRLGTCQQCPSKLPCDPYKSNARFLQANPIYHEVFLKGVGKGMPECPLMPPARSLARCAVLCSFKKGKAVEMRIIPTGSEIPDTRNPCSLYNNMVPRSICSYSLSYFPPLFFALSARCEYTHPPPSASSTPNHSLGLRILPSLYHPILKIKMVLRWLTMLNVRALVRPMIRNWLKLYMEAMIPDAHTLQRISVGTCDRSGMVSKKGTKGRRRQTAMGAWLSRSCGGETAKSSIFLPIHIWYKAVLQKARVAMMTPKSCVFAASLMVNETPMHVARIAASMYRVTCFRNKTKLIKTTVGVVMTFESW